MKNDHIAFQVSDMEAAIAFYTNQLGLRLLSCTQDEEHGEIFAYLELQGGNLELLQKMNHIYQKPAISSAYCPHLALATDNLAQVHERLLAQGVPILNGPNEIPHQVKWLYIADPDNNVIEFVEWLSVS
jgi:catechol 2,3-dioxygenase-like lactoylglutathione lyase family enzyme